MSRMTLACLALLSGTLSAQTPYKTPPQVIVDILDAPPLPVASLSPDRQWLLLLEQRSMPTIAELAAPMLRLDRKSTRLNSSHRCISYAVFCLKKKSCICAESSAETPVILLRTEPSTR